MSTLKPDPDAPVVIPDEGPIVEGGLGGVIRKNLFKDVPNSIITIVFGLILAYALYRSWGFVFNNQKLNPEGELVDAWRVIRGPLETYMVGTSLQATGISFGQLWAAIYTVVFALGLASTAPPDENDDVPPMRTSTKISIIGPPVVAALILASLTETWTPRILTAVVAVVFILAQQISRRMPEAMQNRKGQILLVLSVVAFLLECNFNPGNVDDFGGLLLTINVAFISIALCFPIGVVMALARRSSFPLIRPLAVGYIELIRGVPLITLLFMGQFAIGFFFPPSVEQPPSVVRAIIMVTLFSAAYVAEIVRGGLQSVGAGQTEAGQAVGLSPVTISRKIVLPQALRNSIPALVGQFIALLKDTTLLIIIGLFDLLGVSDPILGSPEFQNQGYASEVYAFVAFMFWVMCFSMSRASQRLETRLGVGTR